MVVRHTEVTPVTQYHMVVRHTEVTPVTRYHVVVRHTEVTPVTQYHMVVRHTEVTPVTQYHMVLRHTEVRKDTRLRADPCDTTRPCNLHDVSLCSAATKANLKPLVKCLLYSQPLVKCLLYSQLLVKCLLYSQPRLHISKELCKIVPEGGWVVEVDWSWMGVWGRGYHSICLTLYFHDQNERQCEPFSCFSN